MKNIHFLPLLIVFMLSAGCTSTYSGSETLPGKKYQDVLKEEKLPPVNVVYKKYNEQNNEYSVDGTNKAAEIFYESDIFSKVGFGEEDMPVQMRVSYRQIGNYNLAQDVFVGATLGMIPQKIEYAIELKIDTFVGNKNISSHKYGLEKVIQISLFDTEEFDNMEKDALVILLDRFFMELLEDADLLSTLRSQQA